MAAARFVWIIRSWCSEDSFWEHVREHKEYDIAYTKPEYLLEEIDRIILKEESDWNDLCNGKEDQKEKRSFEIQKPTADQLKSRPFFKFLTISSSATSTDDFMQSWYVERLKVADTA